MAEDQGVLASSEVVGHGKSGLPSEFGWLSRRAPIPLMAGLGRAVWLACPGAGQGFVDRRRECRRRVFATVLDSGPVSVPRIGTGIGVSARVGCALLFLAG